MEPNGVRRSLPLPARGLTIGRGPDNDLVLAYDLTSRHHARITFDGANYYVVDLGSANGTYIADVRLSPQSPTVWMPNKTLHIGKVSFQLEQTQLPREQSGFDSTETRAGWLPESNQSGSQGQPKNRLALVLLILVFLIVCALLGGGIYYYYF